MKYKTLAFGSLVLSLFLSNDPAMCVFAFFF